MARILAVTVAYESDVTGDLQPTLIGLPELRQHCQAERVEDLIDDLEMLVEDVQAGRVAPGTAPVRHPGWPVTQEQRDILRQAIDDAVYYRDPPQKCAACESSGDLCGACTETLAIGLKYLQIARELELGDG